MTTQTQHPGGVMPRGWHLPHISISALVIFGLALVLLLLAISTASQAFAPQAPNALNLSESDTGKQVTLKSGESLSVRLSGNPTTGYQWVLDSTIPAILKPIGEPVYAPDSALIGAGGAYTWRFGAVAPGQALLRLVYQRTWEQDMPPLRTFEVRVIVQ